MPTRTSPNVYHRFVKYRTTSDALSRVGLVDDKELYVTEVLGYSDLFELIRAHPNLPTGHEFPTGQVDELSKVEVQAPLPGRDVL
jgi:hypothetical protein